MTDLDSMQDLFNALGITFKIERDDPKDVYDRLKKLTFVGPVTSLITDEGIGYGEFHAIYYFDDNGKFITYGVWE